MTDSPATALSREVRAAEPIHVTRQTVGLAGLGFLVWGVGYLMLWTFSTGTRLAWVLCALGPILLGAAALNHLDHHRRRFGLPALTLLNIAIVGQAAVFLPYAINPDLRAATGWAEFTYDAWGVSWLLGALGVLMVQARKESRLSHGDRSAETEVHASFFQLTTLAVGMLLYGISFIGLSTDRTNHTFGWLSVIGPALIAVSIIAHLEHLTLRIGRPAVTLAILGASAWAAKNLARAVTDLMSDPTWSTLLVYGVQGVILLVGAVACLLTLRHKQAWELTGGRVGL